MKKRIHTFSLIFIVTGMLLTSFGPAQAQQSQDGWISLFNGKNLNGWEVGQHAETFSVQDGKIVVHGKRAHLFYIGPVNHHQFDDFEFKADVMTTEGSNSGIYFHTQYQAKGWPSKGYEAQVNNSFDEDPIRTGSLYGIDNFTKTVVGDGTWFTMHIKMEGRHITVSVDDQQVVDYMEPKSAVQKDRFLKSGTFALQGHDPDSKIYFKNIMVRPL